MSLDGLVSRRAVLKGIGGALLLSTFPAAGDEEAESSASAEMVRHLNALRSKTPLFTYKKENIVIAREETLGPVQGHALLEDSAGELVDFLIEHGAVSESADVHRPENIHKSASDLVRVAGQSAVITRNFADQAKGPKEDMQRWWDTGYHRLPLLERDVRHGGGASKVAEIGGHLYRISAFIADYLFDYHARRGEVALDERFDHRKGGGLAVTVSPWKQAVSGRGETNERPRPPRDGMPIVARFFYKVPTDVEARCYRVGGDDVPATLRHPGNDEKAGSYGALMLFPDELDKGDYGFSFAGKVGRRDWSLEGRFPVS